MKKTGILLIVTSLLMVMSFIIFDRSTLSTYLHSYILLFICSSAILFLSGIFLFGFGVAVKEEDKNIKAFAFHVFFIPTMLIISFKLIGNIQEDNRQEAVNRQVVEAKKKKAELDAIKEKKQAEFDAQEAAIKIEKETKWAAWVSEFNAKILKEKSEGFIDNKDGTVTSRNGGLMWQRCSLGQTWTGATCTGISDYFTFEDAVKLKNNFAGHNDWRLPTKDELMTLVYCSDGIYSPYKDNEGECEHRYNVTTPTIDIKYFPNTSPGIFLTSTSYSRGNLGFYITNINFKIGGKDEESIYSPQNVRLVRQK